MGVEISAPGITSVKTENEESVCAKGQRSMYQTVKTSTQKQRMKNNHLDSHLSPDVMAVA